MVSQEKLNLLKKVEECVYELARGYKPGMAVPVRIIADEKLLKEMDDAVLEQASNVATLPGIVGYSFAMPDAHWGYGFCLSKDAKILTNFGFYMPISHFEKLDFDLNLECIDLNAKKPTATPILRFMKLKTKKLLKLVTKAGYEIEATEDHPFLTPNGMKQLKELSVNDKVAIFPFQGVEYQKPSSEIIITEEDIRKILMKYPENKDSKNKANRCKIIIEKLKKRSLLPLSYDHPKLPYIIKIMGFIFGDGTMNFIGKRQDGVLSFAGKKEDLEEVREDIKKIGYTPGPIHCVKRRIVGYDKEYKHYSFVVNASSLVVLLEALGTPRGNKVSQAYRVPRWIFKAPLWQKRLFLASLFGCELRTPHRRLGRRGYFNAPVFPLGKREELIESGKMFLKDISKLLEEFGVRALYITKRKRHVSKKGYASWLLELVISPKPENLFNLWSKIGFEYNSKRKFFANVAAHYLKLKLKILEEKREAIKQIAVLLKKGLSYRKIASMMAGNPLTERFIMDVCYKLNKNKTIAPRIPFTFPEFESCIADLTKGLGKSGAVWDEIKEIKEIATEDFVYDFTVLHKSHNFIANSFVVSNCIGGVAAFDVENNGVISPGGIGFDINCGMRLIATNLTISDVRPKIKELVDGLFERVPCGVGSKGFLRLSKQEFKQVCEEGARWIVEKGYGYEEDLETTEESGCMPGADASKVSDRAIARGIDQVGTLGSGNHYLEIQWLKPENIFDKAIAKRFGLFEDQVVVMFHCGSRGFGHQVASDYLKIFLDVMEKKYGIKIIDRELAAAPFYSKEGQDYFAAMKCAMNMSFANRQLILHRVREVFSRVFKKDADALGIKQVYDVAHNSAKLEEHEWQGKRLKLLVHRKGATRAFVAGMKDLPKKYADIGQPVIIGGSMETGSYLLLAQPKAKETFYSTAHGSGRTMSREKAKKLVRGERLLREMETRGIYVRAVSYAGVAEEAGLAYKNIDEVAEVTEKAGISKRVAKLIPIGNIKG